MSTTEEATVNPDGSTTFSSEEGGDAGASGDDSYTTGDESGDVPQGMKGTDPAIFLFLGFLFVAGIWFFLYHRKQKSQAESESFFSELDGEKVSLFHDPSCHRFHLSFSWMSCF